MRDTNKTIATGVIIAGILTLVSYAIPANGISFGGGKSAAPSQAAEVFVSPLSAPQRGSGGGCGV